MQICDHSFQSWWWNESIQNIFCIDCESPIFKSGVFWYKDLLRDYDADL